MKPFNITLIQPANYPHSLGLLEAAQYVHACLRDSGFVAELSLNDIRSGAHNIVFCAHLLEEQKITALPRDTIIFNSEQLLNRGAWPLKESYKNLLARFYVWDYSLANLRDIGHERKDFIPFTFHSDLVRGTPEPGEHLLFYGSLTDRRLRLIAELDAVGVGVKAVYGKYSDERDALMLHAWAVLNMHSGDTVSTFEPIRCFHPLINSVPVISETSPGDFTFDVYREWLFSAPRQGFAAEVSRLHADRGNFRRAAQEKTELFRAAPGTEAVGDAARAYLEHL